MSDGSLNPSTSQPNTFSKSLHRFIARLTPATRAHQQVLFLSISAIVALLVHAIFLLLLPPPFQKNQSSDYANYYEPVARNLVAGRGLVLGSRPALLYPPGVPILYAITFWISDALRITHGTALRILQALFVVANALLVALVAMRCCSLRIALVASVLWSTYLFNLWLTKQPDPTPPFSVLLLLGVFIFLVWSSDGSQAVLRGTVLGVILGIAALLKPFSIAMPVLFIAMAWTCAIACRRRQRILFSLSIFVAYLMLISPWEIWAGRASGHFIPLCTNGPNALIDGITFGMVRGAPQILMPKSVQLLTENAITHYKQLKTTTSIAHFLIAQLREQPRAVIQLFLLKAARSWYGNESHRFEGWVAAIQLLYLPFVLLGMRIVWKGGRQQRNFLLVAIGVALYFWAMTTLTALALLRYMVPALNILMVLVAVALDRLGTQFGSQFRNQPLASLIMTDREN